MDVVVGGGKYGVEAAKYLRERSRSFVILDTNPECVAVKELNLQIADKVDDVDMDGGEYFLKGGAEDLFDLVLYLRSEYIFPTAPIHVAAEAVKVKFKMEPWNDVVDCIMSGLPFKVIVSAGMGSVVVSYNRDNNCLDKCLAPDICPVTKIKKPCPMYDLIKFAYPEAFVLVSQQLEPGIGAITGEDFLRLSEWVEKKRRIVLATACRCHGVITALKS